MSALLFSSYFAPIQYYSKLLLHDAIIIEHHEHFQKQTYRNRCHIYGANGLLKLSIPMKHGEGEHAKMKDMQIADESDWCKIHWRSIESAYRCSPYFEFYEDALKPLYDKEYKYLVDFNQASFETILKALKMPVNVTYTSEYTAVYPSGIVDYRNSITPKQSKTKLDTAFNSPEYLQVFAPKLGFIENLSILDLLFNEGSNSKSYLENCLVQ